MDYDSVPLRDFKELNDWETVIFVYQSALKQVETKIDILNGEFQQLTISIKLKLWRLLTIINWVLWKLWYRFLSEISRSDVQQRFCMKCMGSRNLRFHRVLRGFSVLRLFQIH